MATTAEFKADLNERCARCLAFFDGRFLASKGPIAWASGAVIMLAGIGVGGYLVANGREQEIQNGGISALQITAHNYSLEQEWQRSAIDTLRMHDRVRERKENWRDSMTVAQMANTNKLLAIMGRR